MRFPLPGKSFPPDSIPPRGLRLVMAPLNPRRLDEVVAIEQVSFSQPWQRRIFEANILHKKSLCLAALTLPGEVLAGYICLWLEASHVQIQNIAVHPALRRRGVAKFMLVQGIKEAGSRGAEHATLEVRTSNLAARRLYASLGFEEKGRLPGYYQTEGEDALLLHCGLAHASWSA